MSCTLITAVAAFVIQLAPLSKIPAGQATGDITEFGVNGAQELVSITAGADGNLWAIDPRANKLIRISPSGSMTEFQLSAGSYPADITAGPDGNVWYGRRGEIGKISPTGEVTSYKIDGMVSGIAAGPDDNLWFCETFRGKIGRCSTNGTITLFDVPTRPGNGSSNPLFICAGPDGKLWFTESNSKANKVGCVTVDGKFSEFALPHDGEPRGITAGPDGNLWVVQGAKFPEEDRVLRISPTGEVHEFILSGVKTSLAQTIVSGIDDNLWFTEPNNPSTKVSRFTVNGDLTRYAVPTAFSGPCGLTVGPDGNLWFTEKAKAKIGRLQTATKGTKYVLHLPSGFVPTHIEGEQGQKLFWINKMPGQSVIKAAPNIDSGARGTGQHFATQFDVAGTYSCYDEKHESHKITVAIALKSSPPSGTKTSKFNIVWSSGANAPDGCVVDVEVTVPGKTGYEKWLDGVSTSSATFEPKHGEGEYRFRSRLRSKSGASCDWSPAASVRVSSVAIHRERK